MFKSKFFLSFICILNIFIFLGGGFYLTSRHALYSPAHAQDDVLLVFEKGENMRQIARQLYRHKLIKSLIIFEIYLRWHGKAAALQAGEYLFKKDMNMLDIIEQMIQGRVLLHPICIVEGLTSQQISETLNKCEFLVGPLPDVIPEGVLLPETYHVPRGTPRAVLVDKMYKDQQEFVKKLWESRHPALPYKTPEEAIILASLIEKETAISTEKPRVCAVFLNRLRLGMRLQADPTLLYGLYKETGVMPRTLTKQDLTRQNEFNTYIITGLPPTPICHPGKEAIYAAFYPLETDELYFVADGSGGHIFARTYEEHQLNHENWRRIRQNR